jgi:hypothetical protein
LGLFFDNDELALTNEDDSAWGGGRLDGFAREGERISPAWHRDIRVSEARVGTMREKKVEGKGERDCSSHSWIAVICGQFLYVYVRDEPCPGLQPIELAQLAVGLVA